MDKKTIFEFIKNHSLAVISTVNSQNEPESAVLEFGETENLELIFDTKSTSRKYKNLKTNQNASFVIGWDENITIQYEGAAEELTTENQNAYREIYWLKNPDAKRWSANPEIVYFKVTPKWIRYSDLNKKPWDIFELANF